MEEVVMCDVEKLISTGENEEIEFKENFDFKGIVETAIAFANKRGGVILVGVRNNGTVVGLSHRQIRAVLYVKEKGSITNKEYQELFKVSRQTATRDLGNMINLGIFERVEKGRYKLKTQHESNMSQP